MALADIFAQRGGSPAGGSFTRGGTGQPNMLNSTQNSPFSSSINAGPSGGFLNNLTSSFTGQPQQDAALAQRQFLAALYGDIQPRIGQAQQQALGFLDSSQNRALDALGPDDYWTNRSMTVGPDYMPGALWEIGDNASEAIRKLQDRQDLGVTALREGTQNAVNAYNPLEQAGQRYGQSQQETARLSADAMGLNGPAGIARAQQAFQTGPGFSFALDQGLESIARNANAAGMVASGNQMAESQRYGTGLAQQEYNNWLNRVGQREALYGPLEAQTLGAVAQGRAGAYQTGAGRLADLYSTTGGRMADIHKWSGQAQADIRQGTGQRLSDLASRYATGRADTLKGTGVNQAQVVQNMLGHQVGLATGLANPYTQSYMNQANALTDASRNTTNTIGNIVSGLFDWFT